MGTGEVITGGGVISFSVVAMAGGAILTFLEICVVSKEEDDEEDEARRLKCGEEDNEDDEEDPRRCLGDLVTLRDFVRGRARAFGLRLRLLDVEDDEEDEEECRLNFER